MYFPELINKKVRFKFTDEKYKNFYGDKYFDGIIVKKGCKNYIESLTNATPEEIINFGYDYFELHEVEFEIIQ